MPEIDEPLGFHINGDRAEESKDCIVAVKQNLQGRIPLQELLAVSVVKGAAVHTKEDHDIAQQESEAGEIQFLPVDPRAFKHPNNGQDEADPADRGHALVEEEVG